MILCDILSVRVMKPQNDDIKASSDRINAVYIEFVELDISLISTFCYLRIQG